MGINLIIFGCIAVFIFLVIASIGSSLSDEDKATVLYAIALIFLLIGVAIIVTGAIIINVQAPICIVIDTEKHLEELVPYIIQIQQCTDYEGEVTINYNLVEMEK